MSARDPQETAELAVGTGAKKTQRTWDRVLVSAFLAGAYIAFGGLVAITVSSGLDPQTYRSLSLLDDAIVLGCAPGHPLAGRKKVTLADCVAFPWIWSRSTCFRTQRRERPRNANGWRALKPT